VAADFVLSFEPSLDTSCFSCTAVAICEFSLGQKK
jgi:hypothetical protein